MEAWIIYTLLTLAYIIVLVVYFFRRSRSHEQEVKQFLSVAQDQLAHHQAAVDHDAQTKINQALALVKKVHDTAASFEKQAQKEYDQIIEDAKSERQELLAKTKSEIDLLFKQADQEIAEYKSARFKEVEKNLVKLVIAVTQKVIGKSLSGSDHKLLIQEALDEVVQKRLQSS